LSNEISLASPAISVVSAPLALSNPRSAERFAAGFSIAPDEARCVSVILSSEIIRKDIDHIPVSGYKFFERKVSNGGA
jgi:hypothetical protein